MPKYIMRLDDASPYMDRAKWQTIENILDKYNITPLVGIVPDCKDSIIMHDDYDPDFFAVTVARWKSKNWTIAQHGTTHKCYFDKDGRFTEFNDLPYEEQRKILDEGYFIMCEKNCRPSCFFAPSHNFDSATIKACADSGHYKFISDGVALKPYKENGMAFLPCIFDTPKALPTVRGGEMTFVCHPDTMTTQYPDYLDSFLQQNAACFVSAESFMADKTRLKKRGVIDRILLFAITFIRKIRDFLRKG